MRPVVLVQFTAASPCLARLRCLPIVPIGWGCGREGELGREVRASSRAVRPRIVGFINDYKLQIVKVKGEFVWHKHDDTDDFFLVVKGRLTIQLRDRDIVLNAGELFVVPKGVEHCPRADEETLVLLIEPRGTRNTGDTESPLTAAEVEF